MNTHQHQHSAASYACPMHPEVKGDQGERCSKCGMQLQPIINKLQDAYDVTISTDPAQITAAEPGRLKVNITLNGLNVPLQVSHEMKLHMMIVSEDLTWFDHIHPQEQSDGSFLVTETFPNGGKYLVYADFKPEKGAQTVARNLIQVEGKERPSLEALKEKLTAQIDGFVVTLVNGKDFRTNESQAVQVVIQKDGVQIPSSQIDDYLGAKAHIVLIGQTDKQFLHIHPMQDNRFPIYAETVIEKPGLYRMWVQFQIALQIHVADFTINVAQTNLPAGGSMHTAHQ
jgi:hypothetical protein